MANASVHHATDERLQHHHRTANRARLIVIVAMLCACVGEGSARAQSVDGIGVDANGARDRIVTMSGGGSAPGRSGEGRASVAATLTWTNASGDGDWFNPANWNPQSVPTASDVVELNAGTLIVPATAAFGAMNFSAGTLWGAFTVVGTLTWTGGTLKAQVTVASGAVLNLSGDEQKSFDYFPQIHNHGTVNWSGAGAIVNIGGNPVWLLNYSDGVVHITGDSWLDGYGNVINEGLVQKTGGAGTTSLSMGTFTNATTGVVQVRVGTLGIARFDNNGRAEVEAGAVLRITGGTSAGTFATPAGARLYLSDVHMPTGTTFEGSGPVYLDGNVGGLVTGTTCVFEAGSLSGAFTATGTLTWTGGTLFGHLTVAPGAVLNLSGDEQKSLFAWARIRNYGTVNWAGAGAIANIMGSPAWCSTTPAAW